MANLHRGPVFDKQPGEFIGLLQGAAAIVAQIYNQAIDTFFLQLFKQFAYITGSALVLLVAASHGVEINVESRDIDHANLDYFVAIGDFQYAFLGRLLLQFYLVAHDGNDFALVGGLGFRRNDLQPHGGVLGSTYQFHHLIKAPADNVFDLAVRALANADDAIRRVQLALFVRGSFRHQAGDLGVFVFKLQHGADTLQRQAHIDVEILRAPR